jgi:hypothetical protein
MPFHKHRLEAIWEHPVYGMTQRASLYFSLFEVKNA